MKYGFSFFLLLFYTPPHDSGGVLWYTLWCLSVHPFVNPSIHLHFISGFILQFSSITLKLGGQLDHEVIQRMLFRSYSTPNFAGVISLFKDFSALTLFLNNSSYWNMVKIKWLMLLNFQFSWGDCLLRWHVIIKILSFLITPPAVFIWSDWNMVESYTMRWCSALCHFKVTIHQILIGL